MIIAMRKKVWAVLRVLGITDILPDWLFVQVQYFLWHGGWLHMNPPRDFNEKIQWQKLHFRDPLMLLCADKYEVRGFVAKRIGDEYLNKCLGVYESVDQIVFDQLPTAFVLKATKASSWNIICADKSELDIEHVKRILRKWMRTDFFKYGREWQYKGGRRRILCEEYVEAIAQGIACEYKLYTFRGVTKYIWVDFKEQDAEGRVIDYRNIYDPDWRLQRYKSITRPADLTKAIPRPECLEKLKRLAFELAQDFPQCRVDFYVIGDKIIFGEMTFTSQGGCGIFRPKEFGEELGAYVDFGANQK